MPERRYDEIVRRLMVNGVMWRVQEAWSAESGRTLLLYESGVESDPDETRRAALDPGASFADVEDAGLLELISAAVPLTPTERRVEGPTGDPWLAQNRGPVWAEGDGPASLGEIVFTRLRGPFHRLSVPGGHLRDLSSAEVRSLLPDE